MFKRYFYLLKNYNRICSNYHTISYKFIERNFQKKKHISFNIGNVQQFNVCNFVTSSLPVSIDKLESQIINLCIYLKNGRVFFDDLEQVIQIYEETDTPFSKDVSLVLLKCCGELLPNVNVKIRQKLTERVWNLIENKDSILTLEHYNTLLEIYVQNSELINPQEFLDKMKLKPDESIYYSLLNVIAKMEDHELLSNTISKFGENLYSWNKMTFDAVIEAHAMQGNITKAHEVINKMQSFGVMPSPETYLCLTYGYAKLGDITNIVQIFEKYQPSIEHVMKVIRIISSYGYGKNIPSILQFLTVPLRKDKLFIINNTIMELAYSGQREEALSVIIHLPMDAGITDACTEYVKCFLCEEIKLNTSDQYILQVIRELMRNKQFPQIINTAAEIILTHGKTALALSLFEDMKNNNMPVRCHYYWPLFKQIHKCSEKKQLYSLISHMISLNIEIDEETIIDYIFPSMDVSNPVAATNAVIDAGINNLTAILSMSAFLLQNDRIEDAILLCSKFIVKLDFRESCLRNSLIKGYEKRKDMQIFVPLLLQIPYTNNPPFLYVINVLLDHAKNSKELDQFIDFLEILRKHNIKISIREVKHIKDRINEISTDTNTINTIEDLLNNMSEETHLDLMDNLEKSIPASVLSNVPHPKKMDSKELQNHIIELEGKNMNYRGTARKLLMELCEKNNLKAAEEMKKNILSNGFEWTPGMSAVLMNLYLKNDLLDKAEVELAEIQNNYSHFLLDAVKVLLYAKCLVKNNRLKDAFDAINNIKVSIKVDVSRKCFHLLKDIASSEHYDITEKMMETLVKNNYCQINNNLLISLFQKHIDNNDIQSVIKTFLHCANKYRQTPMKQMIVTSLVSNLNSSAVDSTENLKKVLKCISSINGEQVALVNLITALAENQQVEKLRKLLQNEKVNMRKLFHHLQFYESSNVYFFLTLFDASVNVEKVPKTDLCNFMISMYEKHDDYEGATQLFKKMKAANVIPSDFFYQKYNELAKRRNPVGLQN